MTDRALRTPPLVKGARLDLTQQEFGRYLVLGKGKRTAHGQFWVCQCGCARPSGTVELQEDALLDGRAQDCGCEDRVPSGPRAGSRTRLKNLVGQQFGRRLVLAKAGLMYHMAAYQCRCVCGEESFHPGTYLDRIGICIFSD
jgi:hypothetical protein